MLNWQDVMVTQERNKDLLRQAEQERLAQQALAGGGTTVWDQVKGLFSGFGKTNLSTEERPNAAHTAAIDRAI